jgi:hypothetical protein
MKFLSFSVLQNYWKHRGAENTEEDNFTEKQLVKENLLNLETAVQGDKVM